MSRAIKKRKPAHYTGILAEPIEWVPPILAKEKLATPPKNCPLEIAEHWPTVVARAQHEDARNLVVELCAITRKLFAIADHFGIDRSQPGWWRDLALNLARRHEPHFMRGALISYAALFAKYGVNPHRPEADYLLARALADRYIPGMRLQPRESPKSRLSTIDLTRLTIAVAAVDGHLKQSIGRSTDRRVVAILRDPKRLGLIIHPVAANEVKRIITTLGNKKLGAQNPLSERILRDYLSWMKTAWKAYCENRANTFQQHFVSEVLPLIGALVRTRDSDPGQI